ncbi:MAG TPA: DNA-3-methyladenine glycosylase [Actinomycetota bacterium]
MHELELAYRAPFAFERALAFLRARAIPGVEQVHDGRFARSMRSPGGARLVIELEQGIVGAPRVLLRVIGEGLDASSVECAERAARRLFDLDADPAVIDAALARDPMLRALVRAVPGTRVPGAIDGFELAVRAIVGQQVSVAGARTTLGRIAERFGDPLASPVGPIVRMFPAPERLAGAPSDAFGMPKVRADAIKSVAEAVSSGSLDLSGDADVEATACALRSIRGIGDWTTGYIAMRALGDADAFPIGDLGVRRALTTLGVPDEDRSIRERADRWRPWRAYAAMHLWDMEN